jgi:hypothetical protein
MVIITTDRGANPQPDLPTDDAMCSQKKTLRDLGILQSLLRYVQNAIQVKGQYYTKVRALTEAEFTNWALEFDDSRVDEDTFIIQYMNDLGLDDWTRWSKSATEADWLGQVTYDEISTALLGIVHCAKAGKICISSSAVFAADILLDIQAILHDDVGSGMTGLLRTAEGIPSVYLDWMKSGESISP